MTEEDFQGWCSIIRAVALTSTSLTPRELDHHAKQLEGESVPYRDFDFPTLEDMLRRVPGLRVLRRRRGETVVQAVPRAESAHIARMVGRQRTARTRSRFSTSIREFDGRHEPHGNVALNVTHRNEDTGGAGKLDEPNNRPNSVGSKKTPRRNLLEKMQPPPPIPIAPMQVNVPSMNCTTKSRSRSKAKTSIIIEKPKPEELNNIRHMPQRDLLKQTSSSSNITPIQVPSIDSSKKSGSYSKTKKTSIITKRLSPEEPNNKPAYMPLSDLLKQPPASIPIAPIQINVPSMCTPKSRSRSKTKKTSTITEKSNEEDPNSIWYVAQCDLLEETPSPSLIAPTQLKVPSMNSSKKLNFNSKAKKTEINTESAKPEELNSIWHVPQSDLLKQTSSSSSIALIQVPSIESPTKSGSHSKPKTLIITERLNPEKPNNIPAYMPQCDLLEQMPPPDPIVEVQVLNISSPKKLSSRPKTKKTPNNTERLNPVEIKMLAKAPQCNSLKRTQIKTNTITPLKVKVPNLGSSSKKKAFAYLATEEPCSEPEGPKALILGDFLSSSVQQSIEVDEVQGSPMIEYSRTMYYSYAAAVTNDQSRFGTQEFNATQQSSMIHNYETPSLFQTDMASVASDDLQSLSSQVDSIDSIIRPRRSARNKQTENIGISESLVTEDFNNWSAIIRDIVLTSKPLPLWKLNRIAERLEGEGIPFKRLNFHTLEDMLEKIPGLELSEQQGKTVVQAIPAKELAQMPKTVKVRRPKKKRRVRSRVVDEESRNGGSARHIIQT